jgi:excisionase family DNA binding protein
MQITDRLLVRPTKAAQLADISRSVAYELIAQGVWPSVRVGRSLRVPVKDLLAWVEANKRPAAVTAASGRTQGEHPAAE